MAENYVKPVTRNRRTWEVYSCGDLCVITVDMDTGQLLVEGSYGPYAHRFHTSDILPFLAGLRDPSYLGDKFLDHGMCKADLKRNRDNFNWWFENIWLQFTDHLKATEGK